MNEKNKIKTIQTIKFNVGGQIYEITRSLLDMYPNTILSKLVSDQWMQQRRGRCNKVLVPLKYEEAIEEEENDGDDNHDGKDEKELGHNHDDDDGDEYNEYDEYDAFQGDGKRMNCIFIDRDGLLFRFVLNYLRDGKVVLPITVDKNTFLHELSYYGIAMEDDSSSKVMVNIQANAQCVLQLNGLIESLKKDEYCIRFSRLCILQFKDKGSSCAESYSGGFDGNKNFFFTVRSIDYGDGGNKKHDESLYTCVEEVTKGGEDMKERCNETLGKFGLSLKHIDAKDVYRQRTKFKVVLEIL